METGHLSARCLGPAAPIQKLTLRHVGQIPYISLPPPTGKCVSLEVHACLQTAMPAARLSGSLLANCPVSWAPGLMAGCLGSRTGLSFLPCLVKADSCLCWDKVSKEHSLQGGFFQWFHIDETGW